MTKIPVSDLKPEIETHWAEFNLAIQGVLRESAFINGPDVKNFEDEFSAYLNVEHSVGLNSGTDALLLALRALGIARGDEVITTAFTFFATAETISMLGATPVFVDIDPVTYNIDVSKIEAKITPRTKAIVPVHLYGHAADMDGILALAQKHKLKVVEDVAQAFSGRYKGRHLGTLGHVGAFSFFPSKNLGAFGDGGMLVTNDKEVAESVRMLRVHGARTKYYNETVGYNSRLDTIQAAILRVKLRHIDAATEGRRRVAKLYDEALASVVGIVCPMEQAYAYHSYHQYTVRVLSRRRDYLHQKLADKSIQTMVYYPYPLHKLPPYHHLNYLLAHSEQTCQEVLSLPIWPEMGKDKVLEVVNQITAALI